MDDHILRIEIEKLRAKVRELETDQRVWLDEFTNVAPSNVDLGYDALQINLAPLFLPAPIRVAAIEATVLDLGAGPQFTVALYRINQPGLIKRDFTQSESQYFTEENISFERVSKGPIYDNDNSRPARYLWKLAPDLVLDPRTGLYAIAFQCETAAGYWRGGQWATTQFAGFLGPTASAVGAFPDSISVKQGTLGSVPVPSFTLRSIRGARRQGR